MQTFFIWLGITAVLVSILYAGCNWRNSKKEENKSLLNKHYSDIWECKQQS
jgi:hypothetical protein